jgi:hypothetical protein
MVKVPVNKTVTVDLWDPEKKYGMVKYFTNTMDLVRAQSDFTLEKGDSAIVVDSHPGFVQVVPEDDFSTAVNWKSKKITDNKGFAHGIFNILKNFESKTGGILSLEDIFSELKQYSIRDLITKKHLNKVIATKDPPFDVLQQSNTVFLALKASDSKLDQIEILKLTEQYEVITIDTIQQLTKWTDLRISRIFDYFVEIGRCRKDSSYRKGIRYYFQPKEN